MVIGARCSEKSRGDRGHRCAHHVLGPGSQEHVGRGDARHAVECDIEATTELTATETATRQKHIAVPRPTETT